MDQAVIVKRVKAARGNSLLADQVIRDYLPFIKSEVYNYTGESQDGSSDELSIAMIAFHEAIEKYDEKKGNFLSFASLIMRNRLIDHYRSEKRHYQNVSLETPLSEDIHLADTLDLSTKEHQERVMRSATVSEIQELSQALSRLDLSLTDIADSSPKQYRTLEKCEKVIRWIAQKKELIQNILKTKKLPMKLLTKETNIDKKTMERHRKYLLAMVVVYSNGFEIIRNHLKMTIARKEDK